MQMRFSGLIVGLFFGFTAAKGQVGIKPSADTLYGSANEIVVTATRTEKKLSNVAVPVTLISSRQIAQAGSVRLADILQEQAGLFITTGTSPTVNAVLATITYNTAFSTAPVVVITPANAATASLAAAQAVWVNITTTGFTINTNTTAVVSSTAYKWNYVVIQ